MNDLDLLQLEAATIFVLTQAGRIMGRNSPAAEPGPRLHLKGCPSGNALHLGNEVSEATARKIEGLVANEPPLCNPDSTATHVADYLRLLGAERPVERSDEGLLWVFPESVAYRHPATLVGCDTPEGDRLLALFTAEGMPPALVEAGFVDAGELWRPWCIALDDADIASIAFVAGLGPTSAEVGVYTVPAYRGHGFAAAATAGWASLPPLRRHTLFYGTSKTNASSQRVVQRLGLRFLGSTLSIT